MIFGFEVLGVFCLDRHSFSVADGSKGVCTKYFTVMLSKIEMKYNSYKRIFDFCS